jgi:hypothetical protein
MRALSISLPAEGGAEATERQLGQAAAAPARYFRTLRLCMIFNPIQSVVDCGGYYFPVPGGGEFLFILLGCRAGGDTHRFNFGRPACGDLRNIRVVKYP